MLLVVVVGGIEVPCTLPSILRERSLLFYWLKLVQGQGRDGDELSLHSVRSLRLATLFRPQIENIKLLTFVKYFE